MVNNGTIRPLAGGRGRFRGWGGLAVGCLTIWFLAYVALPLGQRLPLVAPWMKAVAEADINTTAYWYTQSEETAEAALLVRHKMEGFR